MSSPDPLRGTGRTTRLVTRALIYAATHPERTAFYLVYNLRMVDHIRRMAADLCEGSPPRNFRITSVHTAAYSGVLMGTRARAYFDHHRGESRQDIATYNLALEMAMRACPTT